MQPVGQEVACRAFHALNQYALEQGITPEALTAGSSLTLAELLEPQRRVSWEFFVDYIDRVERLLGEGAYERAVGSTSRVQAEDRVYKILSLLGSPRLVYRMAVSWATSYVFSNLRYQFEQPATDRLRIVLSIPDGYRGSLNLFRGYRGLFRFSFPPLLGLAEPDVTMNVRSDHEAEYLITFHRPKSLRVRAARVLRLLRLRFSAGYLTDELTEMDRRMRAHYDQLLKARSDVVERDTRLRLAGQMAGVSRLSALGEMAGAVAHEINNPLTALGLATHQLRDMLQTGGASATEMREQLRRIESTTRRIARIVQSLLAVGRNAGDQPLQAVELARLFEATADLCAEKLRHAGIMLTFTVEPGDLRVVCRPAQLSLVLLNLANNAFAAVESLPSDERWMRFAARSSGSHVEISITDGGHGIARDLQDRIFEPFFTTRPFGQGPGLGLSVSRGLVESQGGSLRLDLDASNTRFVVRLPAGAQPEAFPPPPA